MSFAFRQSLFLSRCLFLFALLSWLSSPRPGVAQCLPGLCTGDLTAGQCGINDTVCTGSPNNYTPPSPCAGNGCNFVNNCRLPTVDNGSIEVLPGGNGTFIARLKMDVLVPWNKVRSVRLAAGGKGAAMLNFELTEEPPDEIKYSSANAFGLMPFGKTIVHMEISSLDVRGDDMVDAVRKFAPHVVVRR